MSGGNLLSDEALEQVRQVVRQVNGEVRGTRGIDRPPIGQGPECFFALTPSGGIPAIDGSAPGTAECELYEAVASVAGGTVEMAAILDNGGNAVVRDIYNASGTAIAEDIYTPVHRTKPGAWTTHGSSSPLIYFAGVGVDNPRPTYSSSPSAITMYSHSQKTNCPDSWAVSLSDSWWVCSDPGYWHVSIRFDMASDTDQAQTTAYLKVSSNSGSTWSNVLNARYTHPAASSTLDSVFTSENVYEFADGDLIQPWASIGSAATGSWLGVTLMLTKIGGTVTTA